MSDLDKKTIFDEFMLSEYETIAAAHFDLHNGLRQNFRFYLGLVALPFSVWAVAFRDHSDVFRAPNVLLLLFGLIPVLGFMMYLQMVHTRFDIILYTRAVNGVRGYFLMRAKETGVADFEKYLRLPSKVNVPPYREGPSRPYWWQFAMIGSIDSLFAGLLARNYSTWCVTTFVAGTWAAVHIASYYGFGWARENKEM